MFKNILFTKYFIYLYNFYFNIVQSLEVFNTAVSFNSDLSKWNTAGVTTLKWGEETFNNVF